MAGEHLPEELKVAGLQLLRATDSLDMRTQGAMWIRRHELNDWRYYLVTSLVDTLGRRETYKLLLRIFSASGADKLFPKELTVEDIHLGSPNDKYFQRICLAIRVDKAGSSWAEFKDCVINGIQFDGVIYRAVSGEPPSDREAEIIQRTFWKRVKEIEAHGIAA
jgi:hypothetical protein